MESNPRSDEDDAMEIDDQQAGGAGPTHQSGCANTGHQQMSEQQHKTEQPTNPKQQMRTVGDVRIAWEDKGHAQVALEGQDEPVTQADGSRVSDNQFPGLQHGGTKAVPGHAVSSHGIRHSFPMAATFPKGGMQSGQQASFSYGNDSGTSADTNLNQLLDERKSLTNQLAEMESIHKKEVETLQTTIEELRAIQHGSESVNKLIAEKTALANQLTKMESIHTKEVETLTTSIEELRAEKKERESQAVSASEIKSFSDAKKMLETQLQDQRTSLETFEKRHEEQSREIDGLQSENGRLHAKNVQMTRETEALKRKIDEQQCENDQLCNQNIKIHNECAEVTAKLTEFQNSYAHQSNRITELSSWVSELESANGQLNQKLQYVCGQNQQYQQQHNALQEECQRLTQRYRQVEQEKLDAIDAKQKLLLRLSEMAGAKLTQGNPHIADLSDQNRPTKLGEKYSELYDNEWTDAFEEITEIMNKKEDEAISDMLKMTMEIFKICMELAEGHQENIFTSVMRLPMCVGAAAEAAGGIITESVDEIPDEAKISQPDTELTDTPISDPTTGGRESPQMPMHTEASYEDKQSTAKKTGPDLEKSLSVSDQGSETHKDSHQKEVDLPIEMSKQLKDIRKYVALQLLADVQKECMQRLQHTVHNPLENLVKNQMYIMKCTELCWLMCIQDPPLYLIGDAEKGSPFDVDVYRHYTRTGKTIDYVVWPALSLHENGPLLCKGVAQGQRLKKT